MASDREDQDQSAHAQTDLGLPSPFTHNGQFPHAACHLFVYVLLFSGPAVIYKTPSMEGWSS